MTRQQRSVLYEMASILTREVSEIDQIDQMDPSVRHFAAILFLHRTEPRPLRPRLPRTAAVYVYTGIEYRDPYFEAVISSGVLLLLRLQHFHMQGGAGVSRRLLCTTTMILLSAVHNSRGPFFVFSPAL